jgi:subtilisin family serine protease
MRDWSQCRRITGRLLPALGLLLGIGLAATRGAAPVRADLPALPYYPDHVLVAFQDDAPHPQRVASVGQTGLALEARGTSARFARLRITPEARAAGEDVGSVLAALRRDPSIRVAEPDYVLHGAFFPDDPKFPSQYALQNAGQTGGMPGADIDAVAAWDTTRGSSSVVVAVVDSGVDVNHEDLSDNILRDGTGAVMGWDFLNNDSDPEDDNGHGTHVAGIIGASGNNRLGVAGVCHVVKIMPVKFLDAALNGSTADAIRAIDFAIANKARIINASFGGASYSQLLLEALARARNAGVLVVAAAGNSSSDNDRVPIFPSSFSASQPNVVSVAATDAADRLWNFSNFGAGSVDLGAPGDEILSTTPNNTYSYFSGTSMAAPHVSGVAALLLAHEPSLTAIQLKSRILANVDKVPALAMKVRTSGRLNARKALLNNGNSPGQLVSLTINPPSVTGGKSATATVTLDGKAPEGGVVVSLSSDNAGVVSVPESVVVEAGSASLTFPVSTTAVATSTSVRVSASADDVDRAATLLVTAAVPASLTFKLPYLDAGGTTGATLSLTGPAPPGGATVTLSSDNSRAVNLPSTITVPAGSASVDFLVGSVRMGTPATVTLTATLHGFSTRAALTVLPPSLQSLKLRPSRVPSGRAATGTVSLRFAAPANGVPVTLTSSNPSGALPPQTVLVPGGLRKASFQVTTGPVKSSLSVFIGAAQGGVRKTVRLVIRRR